MGNITSFPSAAPAGKLTPPEPLKTTHDLSAFDCGKAGLNDWLRLHALKTEGRGSRTYVVCDGSGVIGYYALSAGAVEHAKAPGNLKRNMPDPVPVFVLGRLAVALPWQGKRMGAGLLRDALKRALAASTEIGARAILVHAIDNETTGFYLQYKFKSFPTDARTLYLPLSHVAALL